MVRNGSRAELEIVPEGTVEYYEVRYAENKQMDKAATLRVDGDGHPSASFEMEPGKKYYVQVRTCGKSEVYSEWSGKRRISIRRKGGC